MLIRKCDICKKTIKDRDDRVTAGSGWDSKEFCIGCGRPVIKFLLSKSLITKTEFDKLKLA